LVLKETGGKGAIICLRIIIEKMYNVNKPFYIVFVDSEKAFDNMDWTKLFKIIENVGID